jgi:hypothetical protein
MATGNDKTVNVTFNAQSSPQFAFDPEQVVMKGSGEVRLERADAKGTWTFVTGQVKDDKLHQFSVSIQGGGKKLRFRNGFKDTKRTPYSYTITILADGREYTSPDPEIVNDPPQGGP